MRKTKTISALLLILLIVSGCEKESIEKKACGVEQPTVNLPWLANIIAKAEGDQTGNYTGKIWIKSYKGQDYIVTDMALESGGLAFHCFDCNGHSNPVNDIEFYKSLTNKELVFSSRK